MLLSLHEVELKESSDLVAMQFKFLKGVIGCLVSERQLFLLNQLTVTATGCILILGCPMYIGCEWHNKLSV